MTSMTHDQAEGRVGPVAWSICRGNDSATPVVLLHGATGSRTSWRRVLAARDQERTIVNVDLRGHGMSDFPDSVRDRSELARDIIAVIDEVLGRAVITVGASLGTTVAMNMLALEPRVVAGMLLVDPPLLSGTESPESLLQMSNDLSALRQSSREELERRVRRNAPDATDEELGDLVDNLTRFNPRFVEYGLDWFVTPWRTLLRDVDRPVVVLAADPAAGGIISEAERIELIELIGANGEVEFLPGCGHAIATQDPGLVAQRLADLGVSLDSRERR